MPLPWFRFYHEFATDPKVQMLPENYQRRYVMLLCMRCSNGDVTLHDEEIAFQLRISASDWEETKAAFISKNMITKDNKIVNWDKRQFTSDTSTERVRAYRNKKKQLPKRQCNVSVTPPDTDTDTDTDTEKNILGSVAPKPKQKKGFRLPDDWKLSDEDGEWALDQGMDYNAVVAQAQKFRDYWHSVAGAKGVKLNWSATWRNWIRNHLEYKK